MKLHPVEFKILRFLEGPLHAALGLPKTVALVVQVSGGKDSMALLGALHSISCSTLRSGCTQIQLVVQHFNHQKRGAESDADALFVERTAREFGCGFRLETAGDWGNENFHLEARQWRRSRGLALANELSDPDTSAVVCTAHHATDHIESVLQHIVRGCGVTGLIGLKEFDANDPERFWRPFAEISAEVLAEYVASKSVTFREDSSNAQEIYQRNIVRHRIVPLLRELNPSLEEAFLKLSDSAREVSLALESYEKRNGTSEILLTELTSEGALLRFASRVHQDLKSVLTQNSAKNILHEALAARNSSAKDLLRSQRKVATEKKIPLQAGWVAHIANEKLVFYKRQEEDNKMRGE